MEGCKLERELSYQKETSRRARMELAPVSEQVISRYTQCRDWRYFEKETVFHFIKICAGGRKSLDICEFGCGDGINVCQIARVVPQARVCGLDISPDLVELAQDKASINGVAKQVEFLVGDVEQDVLGSERFDIVLALNILHHVDIRKTVPKLLDSARPGALVIMLEPIAFSRGLQKLRDLTPVEKDVSPDERQLDQNEVAYLVGLLERPTVHYYNLFGRLARLLPNRHKIDEGHRVTKGLLKLLRLLDLALFAAVPCLRCFAGRVVITGFKPATSAKCSAESGAH